MKNEVFKKYLRVMAIYTAIYIFVLFIGVITTLAASFLYAFLPNRIYYNIADNRVAYALFLYLLGALAVSAFYVFRLGKLIKTVSNSFSVDFREDRIPEELSDFSKNLKQFKLSLLENERARKAAEQQKNDLLIYLAHDLKTPLTSVIGYLSLLDEAVDMPIEQRAKYVGIALDKAYRLEQLINEFFDITRLNLQTLDAQKTRVNLTVLLLQAIGEFYPMFEEKNLRVVQNIESELFLFVDTDKLARVFDNLLRNAVNYSYPDTEIVFAAHKNGNKIIVSVKNRGEDIPQEKLNRVFEKFYRLDASRGTKSGGAGLGLAIAKEIVEKHGGEISAKSADGTIEFTVSLPQ